MRLPSTTLLVATATVTAAWAAPAAEPGPAEAPAAEAPIILRRCLLQFERSTQLGAAQMGVLQECLVRPGDRVRAGQILGRLADQDLRAELEHRRAEAANDTEVRAALAKHAQALNRLKSSEALSRRNLVSAEEHQAQKLEVETAGLEIEAARHRQNLAQIACRQTEAILRTREFIAPHEGIVVAVLRSPGESIVLNEPVFQVVDPARVRVTGFLDVGDAWRTRAGQPVRIWPEVGGAELDIEDEVFEGTVEFVDNQVNPDHQTCKITAVVQNRDLYLRAGLEARMEIRAAASAPGTTKETAGAASTSGPRTDGSRLANSSR